MRSRMSNTNNLLTNHDRLSSAKVNRLIKNNNHPSFHDFVGFVEELEEELNDPVYMENSVA